MHYSAISYIKEKDLPNNPIGKFVRILRKNITTEYFRRTDVPELNKATVLLAYPFPGMDGSMTAISLGLKSGHIPATARNFSPDMMLQIEPKLDPTQTEMFIEAIIFNSKEPKNAPRLLLKLDLTDRDWYGAADRMVTEMFGKFITYFTTGEWESGKALVLVKDRDPNTVH